jgi:hypothetical protein
MALQRAPHDISGKGGNVTLPESALAAPETLLE